MRRGVRVFAAIALAAVVGVSACAKKKPVPPPAPPPAARGSAHDHAGTPAAAPARAARDSAGAADRGRDLRPQVAG